MVILDTSAVVALLTREPEAGRIAASLQAARVSGVGAPVLAETAIVMAARLRSDPRGLLERFLEECGVEVIPFTKLHANVAYDARRRFGRGVHPASLNYGDCLSYAVARVADRPLLCTGDDFRQTDLVIA